MRIDSPLMTNAIATGSFQGTFNGTYAQTLVSSSAQIDIHSTDGYVANENIDHSSVTITAGTGLTGGGTIAATRTLNVASANNGIVANADNVELAVASSTFTGGVDARINAKAVTSGSAAQIRTQINVEDGADVTDTSNVTSAGALMDSELTDLAGVKGVTISTLQVKPSEGAFADGDKTKLDAIEASATADQTNAEIRAAVEAATDSNVFADADHTKLNGIEASADVTDTSNVTSAGALMDSELTSIADVKALDQSVISGASPTFGTANLTDASNKRLMTDAQETKLDSVESNADVTDTANVTSAGALMDSELTNLAAVKAINQSLVTGASPTFSALAITNNVTISGNLSVLGDAVELGVSNLTVEDKLISIASGAADSAAADGAGLFISGAGESLKWNHGNSRFDISDDFNVTGNITLSGTVDGRDVDADGTKLDGIESSATADQSDAEIRTAVEAASDSNVFTDADHTKLNGIEASATADQTDAEIRTAVEAASDSNVFTDADHTKLNGIEASATADQTNAEIKAAVEAASDSNTFTDADHTKLNAIEASADVTDTTNVTAAGALMDSELADLAAVKAIDQGLTTSSDVRFDSLGIGVAASGTTGHIKATNDIVAFASSDERLKDNIVEIEDALDKVESIKGVKFDWNDKQEIHEGHDVGVIAQDIEKVLPEIVETRDNGYKAVKYEKLTALLIQAVKELSAKVKELENK